MDNIRLGNSLAIFRGDLIMHLFMIYIGGKHEQSLVELHDIRFVVAPSIEETYDALRKSWWGVPTSLHLDAWGIVNYVDGYNIHISRDQQLENANKLFFVNLGGCDNKQFMELHKNIVVIANDEFEAKQKAVKKIDH